MCLEKRGVESREERIEDDLLCRIPFGGYRFFCKLAICLSYLYLVETMLSAEPIHDGNEADTFSWHQATAIMGIEVSLNLCEAYFTLR